MHLIPLTENETQIILEKMDYEVFVAGGHTVETERGFSLTIKSSETGVKIHLNELVSRLRTYENNKKAVKCYNFKVKESGNYTVIVKKPECLKVKNSMLAEIGLLTRFFLNFISPERSRRKNTSEIDLVIKRKY